MVVSSQPRDKWNTLGGIDDDGSQDIIFAMSDQSLAVTG